MGLTNSSGSDTFRELSRHLYELSETLNLTITSVCLVLHIKHYLLTRLRQISSSSSYTSSPMTTEAKKQKTEANELLQVFLRSDRATLPTKGSALAAGYDIYAAEDATIPGHGQGVVATDISVIVPYGTYGRIAPRSGLALKHGISTGAGVVDADYRGEIRIILFNHKNVDFDIKKGDRIAQMVLERIVNAEIKTISESELIKTERGENGFGSTGTN